MPENTAYMGNTSRIKNVDLVLLAAQVVLASSTDIIHKVYLCAVSLLMKKTANEGGRETDSWLKHWPNFVLSAPLYWHVRCNLKRRRIMNLFCCMFDKKACGWCYSVYRCNARLLLHSSWSLNLHPRAVEDR